MISAASLPPKSKIGHDPLFAFPCLLSCCGQFGEMRCKQCHVDLRFDFSFFIFSRLSHLSHLILPALYSPLIGSHSFPLSYTVTPRSYSHHAPSMRQCSASLYAISSSSSLLCSRHQKRIDPPGTSGCSRCMLICAWLRVCIDPGLLLPL